MDSDALVEIGEAQGISAAQVALVCDRDAGDLRARRGAVQAQHRRSQPEARG
jgi:hypothetical protein